MHLVQFTCEHFRALADISFEPGRGVNVIHGGNGQGKTSLLEAILFAATARSHRTSVETDLVRHGEQGFHLSARASRRDRETDIEAQWRQGVKRFKVNGVAQTRVSDILGKINVVLFSPEDIALVKGTAAHRRKFLDMELSQISPPYLNALQHYRQVLRQRNELLRAAASPASALLDVWDEQLVRHGAIIMREREAFIGQLAQRASEAYRAIADGEELGVAYQPDAPSADTLAGVVAKARSSDVHRRATTRGPHRDDLSIAVKDQSARSFASQGQQRTAALSLRLAELALVKDRTGEYPILMLDEVLSELDETRAGLLVTAIDPDVQCLLTTAALSRHAIGFQSPCNFYRIERGALEKQEA